MSFFKVSGDKIILAEADYMLAYVPEYYFESGLAEDYGGEYFSILGLFNVEFYNKDKKICLKTFNVPTTINFYPVSYETRDAELIFGVERYMVLKFDKGLPVTNKQFIQSSKAVEGFMTLIDNGKLPLTIPYDKLYDIWTANMTLNSVTMSDVPSASREMILAEKYRDKSNPEVRFGIKAGKDSKKSMYDYHPATARELTKYAGTFNGFTFEDMDSMIINGVIVTKTKRKQTESPLEPVIKY